MTQDTEPKAREFVEKYKLSFPVALDPGEIADRYQLVGHPMGYFISDKGELLETRVGGTSAEALSADFERLFFN